MNYGLSIFYPLLCVLLVFESLLAIALFKKLDEVKKLVRANASSRKGLAAGTPAPPFKGTDARSSAPVSLPVQRTSVLLFVSPDCSVCRHVLGSLRGRAARESRALVAAVCCVGGREVCAKLGAAAEPTV